MASLWWFYVGFMGRPDWNLADLEASHQAIDVMARTACRACSLWLMALLYKPHTAAAYNIQVAVLWMTRPMVKPIVKTLPRKDQRKLTKPNRA